MKLKIKTALVLLTGVVLCYTACKKSDKKPTPVVVTDPQTLSMETISGQIATNIAQSFTGTYGGVNINSGVTLPAFATLNNAKPVLSTPGALCTFTPDTTVNYSTTLGDTLKSQTSGVFKFFAACDSGKVTGYTIYDSLATAGKASKSSFAYNVSQYFVVNSLNTANTLLSLNGQLKSYTDVAYTDTTKKPLSVHSYYVLSALTFDLSKSGDIVSGAATFQSVGSNSNSTWYYTGTITFLGNHTANILINGKIYNVNLVTGKATVSTI